MLRSTPEFIAAHLKDRVDTAPTAASEAIARHRAEAITRYRLERRVKLRLFAVTLFRSIHRSLRFAKRTAGTTEVAPSKPKPVAS